jgi:hypothetical protein
MHRLGWRGCAALAALAIVSSVVLSATSATASTGCHYDLALRQWVCQALISPGLSPHAQTKLLPGPSACSWLGKVYQCHDEQMGWFDNRDGCYYLLMIPQPAYDSTLWEGHPSVQGAIYQFMCPSRTGTGGGWQWRVTSPQPAAVVPAVQLAQQAFATLTLPKPVPPSSPSGARLPDGRPYTVVQVPTWYWTTPASYVPQHARAAAGPVWAQVTVAPVALTFAPGNTASTVSCVGPGTVWTAAAGPWTQAPGGCDYGYPQSTYGYPGGELSATYGIVWRAVWTGSGGTGGTFPDVTSTATARFAVAEAQAVIVRGRH